MVIGSISLGMRDIGASFAPKGTTQLDCALKLTCYLGRITMLGETKQATSATTSLIYITLGSLISVWMVIYYLYLRNHNGSDTAYLWVAGFFCSGVVLFLIGLAVGRIGNASRPAETSPAQSPQVIAQTAVPNSGPLPVTPSGPAMTAPIMAAQPVVLPVPPNPPAYPVSSNSPDHLAPNT
ncbi:MAG: hypothetical protein JWM11_6815 [Planctomycetaceae bacterium]|nr:hypothetical protein [Planctomycetaceae bacterium]